MTQDPESLPAFRSFPITLFSGFELSVGLIDLPVDHTIKMLPIVYLLHCIFSVVSYILLLNLLIAMMSDTHWRVAQERDDLWRTQVSDVAQKKAFIFRERLSVNHTALVACYRLLRQP